MREFCYNVGGYIYVKKKNIYKITKVETKS